MYIDMLWVSENYRKNGYEIFGELDNVPAGHKRYYMRKIL